MVISPKDGLAKLLSRHGFTLLGGSMKLPPRWWVYKATVWDRYPHKHVHLHACTCTKGLEYTRGHRHACIRVHTHVQIYVWRNWAILGKTQVHTCTEGLGYIWDTCIHTLIETHMHEYTCISDLGTPKDTGTHLYAHMHANTCIKGIGTHQGIHILKHAHPYTKKLVSSRAKYTYIYVNIILHYRLWLWVS